MEVETTKMSSKGQVVIPQDIRTEFNLIDGTLFAVMGNADTIILKKLETPSKDKLIEGLENIAKEGRKRAEKLGIKEQDINKLLNKTRNFAKNKEIKENDIEEAIKTARKK